MEFLPAKKKKRKKEEESNAIDAKNFITVQLA